MTFETITVDITDQVATLTLNRPARLNACTLQMAAEISDALGAGLGDARCLIITGAGKGFCSGADLQAAASATGPAGHRNYTELTGSYNPLVTALTRLDIPIVTAVNGAAAGIGCSIGLAGDFVFAGKSGFFLQAFVNVGLVPDGGASWMLPRLIGKVRATEMMMLGEKIPGDKAAEWGMIYRCVADDDLQADARAMAIRLANGPTVSYAVMRRNIMAALENSFADQLLAEAEGQRTAGSSADAAEGIAAFNGKRKPAFTGR